LQVCKLVYSLLILIMLSINPKISIEEFDSKNYQIKLVEPYDKALITH